MKRIAVMPLHDPEGLFFPHLARQLPFLKQLFRGVITLVTAKQQPDAVAWLQRDPFFKLLEHKTALPVGKQFKALYQFAVDQCVPDELLHICYPDRVLFALSGPFRAQFMADVGAVMPAEAPILYHRSAEAWSTHPAKYHKIEGMVTALGEVLFGKTIDFGWCYMVATAAGFQYALDRTHHERISMVAEIALALRDKLQTRDVDWLAWEDPFLFGRDAVGLKAEREMDSAETSKRLHYVIPMFQMLADAYEAEVKALEKSP